MARQKNACVSMASRRARDRARRRERELLGFEWAQATLFPCLAVQAPLRVGGARGVD